MNSLYFICPTDSLEAIINNEFSTSNYYYASLGNSINLNNKTINSLEELIIKNGIVEINLILANDNCIIKDALGDQHYSNITGLNEFYYQLKYQKKFLDLFWKQVKKEDLMLSFYLNNKVKELEIMMKSFFINPIKINGKIYNKQERIFKDISFDSLVGDYFSLN